MKRFRSYLKEERVNPETFNLYYFYNELNRTIFDNELSSSITVNWKKLPRGTSGQCNYKVLRKTLGGRVIRTETVPDSIEINIASLKFTEEKLKGILAHEMIHALIAQRDEHEREQHGPLFMNYLRKFQTKCSFTIPVSDEIDIEEYSDSDYRETVLLIFGKPNNGVSFGNFTKSIDTQLLSDWIIEKEKSGYLSWGIVVRAKSVLSVPAQRNFTRNRTFWIIKSFEEIKSGKILWSLGKVPQKLLDIFE